MHPLTVFQSFMPNDEKDHDRKGLVLLMVLNTLRLLVNLYLITSYPIFRHFLPITVSSIVFQVVGFGVLTIENRRYLSLYGIGFSINAAVALVTDIALALPHQLVPRLNEAGIQDPTPLVYIIWCGIALSFLSNAALITSLYLLGCFAL
jgi:hypothetical protein